MSEPANSSNHNTRHGSFNAWPILILGLIIFFFILRCAASLQELWLDEIWAFRIIEPLKSPVEIWTKVRIDNHCLYSAYLYFLDAAAPNWLFRLPSLFAGLGSMVLAGLIGREQLRLNSRKPTSREEFMTATVSVVLIGGSYMNIHFDSEARGYSLCVFFCLFAFYFLLRGQSQNSFTATLGYWAGIALGLLAHPIAVHMLIAGGVWSTFCWLKTGDSFKQTIRTIIVWHAVPTVFFLGFYFFYVRHLESGGATEVSAIVGIMRAFCFTFGVPLAHAPLALVLAATLVIASVVLLIKCRNDLWVFYFVVVLASPVLICVLRQSPFNYSRYFIVNTSMALLITACLLGQVFRLGILARVFALAMLALFVVGNSGYTTHLLRFGRGQYVEAIRHMDQNTASQIVTVVGDHDFRHSMSIEFHADRLGLSKQIAYSSLGEASSSQWVLLHSMEFESSKPPEIRDVHGNRHRLVRTFPSSYLAGFRLYLYQNLSAH